MLVNYYYYLCLCCLQLPSKDTQRPGMILIVCKHFLCSKLSFFCLNSLNSPHFFVRIAFFVCLYIFLNKIVLDLPLNAFMCATAILKIVNLSGFRASALHVGTISDNSVMYAVILFLRRRSISQWFSLL